MKISAALAASVPFAGAVGACGDGDKAGGVAGPVPNALSELVKDAKGSLEKALDKTSDVTSVSFTMDGTSEGQAMQLEGSVQLAEPVRMAMTGKGPDGEPIEMRIIGTAIYIKMDPQELDGKTWMKMDVGGSGQGQDFTKQLEDTDPVKQVKTMLAGNDVTVVGEETIDGVQTVHYTTTVPVDKYLEQLDANTRDAASKTLTEQGVTEITTDLWVDDQYRPIQVKTKVGAEDLTVKYFDYDKPVNVEEPPADQTADFDDLLGQLDELTQE